MSFLFWKWLEGIRGRELKLPLLNPSDFIVMATWGEKKINVCNIYKQFQRTDLTLWCENQTTLVMPEHILTAML